MSDTSFECVEQANNDTPPPQSFGLMPVVVLVCFALACVASWVSGYASRRMND